MYGASVYNILSSNVINLLQYISTIIINKNAKKLQNKAIKTDIILVSATIIIPILLAITKMRLDIYIVPLFILLYIFFKFLSNNTHKLYLKENTKEDEKFFKRIPNKKRTLKYIFILFITGILLFFIGNTLSNVLENLCRQFNISEVIIGILLGFITSIPELITFFESQKHHKNVDNDMHGVVEATNNLLTSNILNLFIIEAIGILILHTL